MSAGKLPEEWGQTKIGDIAEVISGGTPKSGIAENFAPSGEGIAWLTPADLSGYKEKNISHGARDLSTQGYSSCSAKLMPAGAILFSSRAPIGYVAVASNEISTNQGFKSFVFTNDIYPDYAYYYLRNIRHLAEEMGTGTTFKEISGSAAKTLPFVMAPLAEQTIIVEKLDTLLAQVDSTKARLEQIPQILKRFRQAVLAAAVSGELTKHLTQTKKNEVTLDKIAKIIDPHPSHRTPKIDDAGIPYIGIGDIQPDGKINFTSARKVSVDVFIEHRARYTLNEGDFIFGKIGTLGKACVLPIGFKYTLSANVILIQPIKDKVSSDYLRYFLSSPLTMQEITQQANSTSQAAFGIKKMRAFKCNLPSLVEQLEIVRRVEQLFAYADTIEKQVNNALTRVNSLTQSILAKAFRGELTAQWRAENPSLISGENSAAALLEKIKTERAASGGKKTSRKKA
ncbi:restriction endonuclease subunit S [Salmonella enterica subsp. enterica serovar Hull]|uniref:Restriction endonuclease subunit S n=1 Tax=Salmonella enterica subsp. enterica serovar Hull TaxID=1403564 RepID=A0A5I6CA25_SALET|nr:restriction endonuclease subunit S [Salmonella enterica]EAA4686218.1 restriction endonuclease subunit S [Salmonella enterica subsp. enterica serovar Hull]ECJ4975504.1 restriction endonuclease subunit S [Salmonella enterica subsp. enterica]EAQ6426284.1 restriction endonuclease subunit S [Salmonella enterica]EAY5229840.1 restriction endonuclease subunit S [Salmonella enterica]EBC8837862.1 restriction endonuclease subunit S [Salmonella enterica]